MSKKKPSEKAKPGKTQLKVRDLNPKKDVKGGDTFLKLEGIGGESSSSGHK